MSFVTHLVLFVCYSTLAAAGGYVLFLEFPSQGPATACLAGALLFLLGALLHETVTRRFAQRKQARHLLALKKAYDHIWLALEKTRLELSAHPAPRQTTESSNPPSLPEISTKTETGSDEDDFRTLFSTRPLAVKPAPPQARAERPPLRRPPPPTWETPLPDEQEINKASSEVKILHSLVEQLYSDIETPADRQPASRQDKAASTPVSTNSKAASPVAPGGVRIADRVDEKRVLEFVQDGLRKDDVDLYLQPIVSLPQRKKRFFECFNYIRTDDGTVITQNQYQQLAIDANILSAIDNMLLFRCIQLLRKVQGQDYSIAFFCNIVLNSLLDKEFFYNFAQYLKNHTILAPSIFLELRQEDYRQNREALTTPMKILGKMGYRFSLDQVDDFEMADTELDGRNFGYLKVSADLLLTQINQGQGHIFRAFKQRMDDQGIDVIVEQIDSEQMLLELLDYNIDYGQGFLFGAPRTGKEAVAGIRTG